MRLSPLAVLQALGLALLPASLLLPTPGCGGELDPADSSGAPKSASLGTAGGSILSADGHLELSVPANALASAATITITPSSLPGAVLAYDVEPAGLALAAPVVITLHYGGVSLGAASPSNLRVGSYVGGIWQALAGYGFDAQAQTISASATQLSSFGGTFQAQVCLARSGNIGCSSASAGGSSSGSSGGSSDLTPVQAGGDDDTCPTISCDDLDPCADVPNATSTSCNIASDGSYTATCCYDPGTPYCLSTGGGSSGSGSGSGISAPPSPSCENATCGAGATLTSCSDFPGGSGFSGTCCYPPGVLPSDPTSSSSSSGAGSGSGGSSGSSSGGATPTSGDPGQSQSSSSSSGG